MSDEPKPAALRLQLTEEQKKLLKEHFGEEFIERVNSLEVRQEGDKLAYFPLKN